MGPPLDFDDVFWLMALDSCVGWAAGLLLLVVGLITVRGALPRAGYLIGGSGALLFVQWCCSFVPTAAYRAEIGFDFFETLTALASAVSLLSRLGFVGLFLAGAIILAREVKARRTAAGGA